MRHQPVLLEAAVRWLDLRPGEVLVDATVGSGGHSLALCGALGRSGRLLAFDADSRAAAAARRRLRDCPCRVTVRVGNFRELSQLLRRAEVKEANAFLFDLGVSTEELVESGRGFSFQRDEPLLMTFASSPGGASRLTAGEIVNRWQEKNLAAIIAGYGEEPNASAIARAIAAARRQRPIKTTGQLTEIIAGAVPGWYRRRRRHFATKTFQALRIAVNDELGALEKGLDAAWRHLALGGRIAVITFHSLEARTVKNFFREKTAAGAARLLTPHSVKPSREEIRALPQARSAQLRLLKKSNDDI